MKPPASTPIRRSDVQAWAREYATRFGGAMRWMTAHRPRICPFERLVSVVPDASCVLDVGCGNGLFLYLLSRAGRLAEGQGVDVRRDATHAGNAALEAEGSARVSLLAAESPAHWPNREYDVVSIIDVLHHVAVGEREAMLAAACGRVAPGGLLVYKDMAAKPAWAAWMNRLHDLALAQQWIRYMPVHRVEAVASTRGFTIELAYAVRIGWYAHELRVFRRSGPGAVMAARFSR